MAKSAQAVKAELTGETNVTVITTGKSVSMSQNEILPTGYKLKQILTLPSLVMKTVGEGRALRFDDAIHLSKVMGKQLADGSFEKPADVAQVTDLDTGDVLVFLLPAVVKKNIVDAFPDNSYVGKCFYIKNMGKRKDGQRYNDFGIAEIDVEAETPTAEIVADSSKGRK